MGFAFRRVHSALHAPNHLPRCPPRGDCSELWACCSTFWHGLLYWKKTSSQHQNAFHCSRMAKTIFRRFGGTSDYQADISEEVSRAGRKSLPASLGRSANTRLLLRYKGMHAWLTANPNFRAATISGIQRLLPQRAPSLGSASRAMKNHTAGRCLSDSVTGGRNSGGGLAGLRKWWHGCCVRHAGGLDDGTFLIWHHSASTSAKKAGEAGLMTLRWLRQFPASRQRQYHLSKPFVFGE